MFVYKGLFLGEGKGATEEVLDQCKNLYKSDLDTKAGREKAFSDTAKCSAEAACAVYSKGAIPPGVCSSIAGPIAGGAIKIWNSVFGDNEEAEKAKIRDANTAALFQTVDKLMVMDAAWIAYSQNTMTKLIQFHDQTLPSRKGAWGGGTLTKRTIAHADITKPGIPTEFQKWDVENYSNWCPIFDKLVKLGGLPTKKPPAGETDPIFAASLCHGITVSSLYYEFVVWKTANPKANAPQKTDYLLTLIKTRFPQWVSALDKAANELRAQAVAEAVKLKVTPPASSSSPVATVAKTAAAAGAGWLAWKYLLPLIK